MHLLRAPDGRALAWYEEPADVAEGTVVATPTVEEAHERIELDTSVEEFEAAARAEAGIAEDEPLGDVFVEDESEIGAAAFGSPGNEGKRVGQKRVRAYAPANPVTELMNELGKNERQSVSWQDLQAIVNRFIS